MQLPTETIVEVLRRRAQGIAAATPIYTYLADGEFEATTLTYGELDHSARSLAAWLTLCGASGERVLLAFPCGLEYLVAFFGCLYARAIAVPALPPVNNEHLYRLQAIAKDAGAKLGLTTSKFLPRIEAARTHTAGFAGMQWGAADSLDPHLASEWSDTHIDPDSVALLQYTSGSTATPRGVMITHRNLIHNQISIHQTFGDTAESVIVSWLPLHHDMGLIGSAIHPIYTGARCVFMAPAAFLQKPVRWLDAITRYRGTTSGGPNFAFELCVRRVLPEQRARLDLSTWKTAFNGAEPVRHDTLTSFAREFEAAGFQVSAFRPCYGLAEATLMVSGARAPGEPIIKTISSSALANNRVDDQAQDPCFSIVSCGNPCPGQRVLIVDPLKRTVVPPECIGEIWVAGPSVAHGYWNRPEETAATFDSRLADTLDGPFLRTGDLGFLHQGELFITGRLKEMMIFHGRNIYPQDVEATARGCDPSLGISAAFSVRSGGEDRLVLVQELERRHDSPDPQDLCAAIRIAVTLAHGVTPAAVLLVPKATIPKTTSGKIQRSRCRAEYLAGSLRPIASVIDEAPGWIEEPETLRQILSDCAESDRTAVAELYLKERIAQLLHLKPWRVDVNQSLVQIGVDSLAAATLIQTLETQSGLRLPVSDLLGTMSIASLARDIVNTLSNAAEPGIAADGSPTDSLSADQKRLWILEQLRPGTSAFHVQAAFRIRGPVNPPSLRLALFKVAQRHDSLRTTFQVLNGIPARRIHASPGATVSMALLDLNGSDERRVIEEGFSRSFDLESGPLLRMILARTLTQEHLLVVTAHHIVCDAGSLRVFARELGTAYSAVVRGDEPDWGHLAPSYDELVRWQSRASFEKPLAYWRETLQGCRPGVSLRAGVWLENPSWSTATLQFSVPAECWAALREIAAERSATPFMVLLAAFTALLHRCSGDRDMVIAAPTAGRPLASLQDAIGLFAYPLLIRTHASSEQTFLELLASVRERALAAYANQDVPFANVVEGVWPKGMPLDPARVQVMFTLLGENFPSLPIPSADTEIVELRAAAADYDILLTLAQAGDSLRGNISYNTAVLSKHDIEQLSEAYVRIVAEIAANPRVSIADLSAPYDSASTIPVAAAPERTLVLAGSFTLEPLSEWLEFWRRELQLDAQIEFAPFHQEFQQLLDTNSLIARNQNGWNVIAVRVQDWGNDQQDYTQKAAWFAEALEASIQSTGSPHIVCICPGSSAHEDTVHAGMERDLAHRLADIPGVRVIRGHELLRRYGVESWRDPVGEQLAAMPYTEEFYAALATSIMREIAALQGLFAVKAVVTDCDGTLWAGICGETGPAGLRFGIGHRKLHEALVEQVNRGRLVCLCSKNNPDDVSGVFSRRAGEMVLKPDHILAQRVNWRDKPDNLRELSDELDLALDSFLFIDDDSVECAQMRALAPEVLTLQLPARESELTNFLDHVWAFDVVTHTREASHRTQRYREEAQRKEWQHRALTISEFLAGLQMRLDIFDCGDEHIERFCELTDRTQQFNVTGRRRPRTEWARLRRESALRMRVAMLRDRFGDYGLIGVLAYIQNNDTIEVDTFALSCRALGRGVEHAMMARLAEEAAALGCARIDVPFRRTSRNRPAELFLESIATRDHQQNTEGCTYTFDESVLRHLRYNPASEPSQPVRKRKTGSEGIASQWLAKRSELLERIATEWCDLRKLRAAVKGGRHSRPDVGNPYVEPRTHIENTVAAAVADLLGLDRVGVEDDFFQLGGHSLQAMQLLSRLNSDLGVTIPLQQLFSEEATVSNLARIIELQQIEAADPDELTRILEEVSLLSDDEARNALVNEHSSNR